MEKILSYLTKNFVSVLGIAILTGTTLTTSALGVMKVANNFEKPKLTVPEVRGVEATTPLPSASPTPHQSSGNTVSIPHPKGTTTVAIPTPLPTTATTTTQASTSTVACAVTLFGKQYDVTNLRNTHSGGNIFNCGTDMTAIYQARHGTDLSRMQKYLIVSGGTTSSNTTTTSVGSNGNRNDDKDHDDEQEVHKEDTNTHDEDREEEEKTHLESFLRGLLHLVVS